LVEELREPVSISFRKLPRVPVKWQDEIIRGIFRTYRPRVGVKYGCTDGEADRTLEQVKAEYRGSFGNLRAVGISLREVGHPDESSVGVDLQEDYLFPKRGEEESGEVV
jgi:hypothetical protein